MIRELQLFPRDLSAVRGEGPYKGMQQAIPAASKLASGLAPYPQRVTESN